jgi:hypothetical protein
VSVNLGVAIGLCEQGFQVLQQLLLGWAVPLAHHEFLEVLFD